MAIGKRRTKLQKRLEDGDAKIDELTFRQWTCMALGYVREWPESADAIIHIPCVCRCCKNTHTREVRVKIHGRHERAISVARTLFEIGRPGIKPEDIKRVDVLGTDCKLTTIRRGEDGKIKVGYTMMSGTIQELVDVGFLRTRKSK
jgi:hypothetical protein